MPQKSLLGHLQCKGVHLASTTGLTATDGTCYGAPNSQLMPLPTGGLQQSDIYYMTVTQQRLMLATWDIDHLMSHGQGERPQAHQAPREGCKGRLGRIWGFQIPFHALVQLQGGDAT